MHGRYTYNISYVYIYNFMSQFQLLQSFWILQSWHCYFYFFQRLNTDMGVILKYKSQTPILSHFGPCHFVLSEIEILLKLLNYSYDLNFVFFPDTIFTILSEPCRRPCPNSNCPLTPIEASLRTNNLFHVILIYSWVSFYNSILCCRYYH